MTVGLWIEGNFASAHGEGLFGYLGLIASGLPATETGWLVCVSEASRPAFAAWRRALPAAVAAMIEIAARPGDGEAEIRAFLPAAEARVTAWLAIRPDYAAIRLFTRPCISMFADFLLFDFAPLFTANTVDAVYEATARNLPFIARLVCFSEQVAETQIARHFGVARERIAVLPHGSFDYAALTGTVGQTRDEAAAAIRAHIASGASGGDALQQAQLLPMLRAFPFEAVPYLFVSTRPRPHKNVVVVAEALQVLLRRYRSIKVVTTARLDWTQELGLWLARRGLHWDFVSVNDTPPAVHAALFRCAALTIHPSPFEGGFPFTVPESVSCGTPAIVADGTPLWEAMADEDRPLFAFDGGNPIALANRIEAVLADRAAILERQRAALLRRTATPMTARWTDLLAIIAALPDPPAGRPAAAIAALRSKPRQHGPLVAGEHVLSPGGCASLTLAADGLAVAVRDAAGAAAHRALVVACEVPQGAIVYLQEDGNLVVYDRNRRPLWSSASAGRIGHYHLTIADDGTIAIDRGVVPSAAFDRVWEWRFPGTPAPQSGPAEDVAAPL